ncbi:hypothetical protein [Actinomadura harenae]|uniref:hypothetical protein n=1 Tax=Actinomadura harenae TaxID=2483351 RepID=UPI003605E982
MTFNDYVVSLVRTAVPVGVGTGLAWIAVHFGILVPEDASSGLKLGATAVAIGVYYAGARAVEHRWPRVGRFLTSFSLVGRVPTYR